MLNFVPAYDSLISAAGATTQMALRTTHQLWMDFEAWVENTKLDRIDVLLLSTLGLLFVTLLRDYTNLTIIEDIRGISKKMDDVTLLPLSLVPEPQTETQEPPQPQQPQPQQPQPEVNTERARLSMDPPDMLTQAMLSVLAPGYSLTAKDLRAILPQELKPIEKGEVNARLYMLMKRGKVYRWQIGTQPPTWSLAV